MIEQLEYTTDDTSPNTDLIGEQLFRSFDDAEYRRIYAQEHLSTFIAFQIRAIREQRGWTQAELGERCGGKAQAWISQLEDPSYGRFTLTTLKTIAEAFDAILDVRFKSFRDHADEQNARTHGDLRVNTYTEDAAASQKTPNTEKAETDAAVPSAVEDSGLGKKRMAKMEWPVYDEEPSAEIAFR